MADYSKLKLSGSTNGRLIKVVATATPGTTIHTAVAGTVDYDEIYLFANNTSSSNVKLTIEWGGVASPDDSVELMIQAESGLVLVIPGLVLQNSLVVKAFAGTTNVINVSGFVNRIDQ